MWYVRDRFDCVCELVLVTVCAGEIEPCVCVVWRGFFYLAPRSALTVVRVDCVWCDVCVVCVVCVAVIVLVVVTIGLTRVSSGC